MRASVEASAILSIKPRPAPALIREMSATSGLSKNSVTRPSRLVAHRELFFQNRQQALRKANAKPLRQRLPSTIDLVETIQTVENLRESAIS